jgi:hypothetical protein
MSIDIFFCYAHEDEVFLKILKKHLKPLQRDGLISVWHDRDINAGTDWEKEIDKHLNTAKIILLLVSPDFMNSDYCYGVELKRAIERHENGEARVIPIILRHIDYEGAPFSRLQALPTGAIPVTDRKWRNRDEAFFDITQSIRRTIKLLSTLSMHDKPEETLVKALSDSTETTIFTREDIEASKRAFSSSPTEPLINNSKLSTASSLCIKQEDGLWKVYEILPGLSLGRHIDNNIVLDDSLVSREHAIVYVNPDGMCILEDLGSSNGTIVNGKILRKGEKYTLFQGDVIQIGKTLLVFNLGDYS